MWTYTHWLQSVKRMWRYLLHKVGCHRNNMGLSKSHTCKWTGEPMIKKKKESGHLMSSRDQRRIITHHLVVINICQQFTVGGMDFYRLPSRLCQYVNLKDNIQPAGPAWTKMTRGIRQRKINGGRIWSMLVSLDKSSLFFSSQVDFGSHLVWPPPPNSFVKRYLCPRALSCQAL